MDLRAHIARMRGAFQCPHNADSTLSDSYSKIVEHDQLKRGVEYTPKDHVLWINELVWPERVRILSKDQLKAVLRDAEWSGMYDYNRCEEEDDVDLFNADKHFVVIDSPNPLINVRIPRATVVSPLFKLCILYWNESETQR